VVDALGCDVERELHEEVAHLFEVLAAHALGFHPEGLVNVGRHDDDAFVTGEPDGEEGEDQVHQHRPDQQGDQERRCPASAGDVLGHPCELHPTISRRCEGGVRLSPVMAAGTCQ
jgi:hypothetical protein